MNNLTSVEASPVAAQPETASLPVPSQVAEVAPFSLRRQVAGFAAGRLLKTAYIYSALRQKTEEPLALINQWHGLTGLWGMEGFMRGGQADFFRELLDDRPEITDIAEIGFNGGHSSFVFLDSRPNTAVVSFDLGEHEYVDRTKGFIDDNFTGRHQLIKGDSKLTVPNYAAANVGRKFDLIFIDGGHDSETAEADLQNMRELANPGSIVVMDDYMPHRTYGVGPVKAWESAVRSGLVSQEAIITGDNRTWAIGSYRRL